MYRDCESLPHLPRTQELYQGKVEVSWYLREDGPGEESGRCRRGDTRKADCDGFAAGGGGEKVSEICRKVGISEATTWPAVCVWPVRPSAGACLSLRQGSQHQSPRDPEDMASYTGQLNVGVLQFLLQNREAVPACFLCQGTGEPALADAGGAEEHYVEFLAHPFATGECAQELAIQPAGLLVVGTFDHGALFQLGRARRRPQVPILFPQPLVIDQQGKALFNTESVRLGGFELRAEGNPPLRVVSWCVVSWCAVSRSGVDSTCSWSPPWVFIARACWVTGSRDRRGDFHALGPSALLPA
jgi:hypothetical protein